MNPTVSVVIPTFNRAALVVQAVHSVQSQTVAPFEIIVVDDGSTDGTRENVTALGERIQYIYRPNGGPAAARNTGIRASTGELIAFLDADDLWVPEALEWRIAKFLEPNEPSPDIVLGLLQRVDMANSQAIYGPWAARSFCTALVRRTAFERVGLLDESLKYAEDIDWFLRVREHNLPTVFVTRVLAYYRIHENSLMADTRKAKLYTLQAVKKSLARRTNPENGSVQPLAEFNDLDELLKFVGGSGA